MTDCCDNGLEVAALEREQTRVLKIVLCINIATFVMMVGGAYLSGSTALLSGTLDNLGDALTYGLSLAVVGATAFAKARVALFKGVLIFSAAIFVAVQIGLRLADPETPVVSSMSIAAGLNFVANLICLRLLYPHRNTDINMSSVFECSRNDVFEGIAVIIAAIAVALSDSAWPDLIIASALLIMFLRSATRVLHSAWGELKANPA